MNPEYPVYIVSKGRWESRLTSKALEFMGVPYKIVVEAQEYEQYSAVIDHKKILVLTEMYLDQYDTCDVFRRTKSVGPGAARNFVWDHATETGAKRHWVLDDNFDAFQRLNRNIMAEVTSGTIFKAAEDFVDRYNNVPVAGFNYYNFCKATDPVPPLVFNTRIYSCLLIKNDAPYRWRGRYNEDTDLSLRVLKDGLCTIQFNAFLAGKVTTQRMKGGNTKDFYAVEGTLAKSQMLADLHPDVASVVWRFNRWHHHVDYRPFKGNRLKKRDDIVISDEINNYGMVLK
jgi:hypothetical protein